MQTINLSIWIDADERVVWDALLKHSNYRECTAAFSTGSGNGKGLMEGNAILVLMPDGNELISRIIRHQHSKVIAIQHEAVLRNGVIDHLHPAAKLWVGLYEIYRVCNKENRTKLDVEQDIDTSCIELVSKARKQMLEAIKTCSELVAA